MYRWRSCRRRFIKDRGRNTLDFVVDLVFLLVDRFVHVVIPGHEACRRQHEAEQGSVDVHAAFDLAAVFHDVACDCRNEPGCPESDPQLPWPEHQVQMHLAADLAPGRVNRFQRDQKLDDQQRPQQMFGHFLNRRGRACVCLLEYKQTSSSDPA
jgi:hypothetical protein